MAGSGGGYFSANADPEQLRKAARDEAERARLAAEVNGLLAGILAQINDRDVDKVAKRLGEIRESFAGQGVDLETLLFGGSVAKHTYVDGLSDVDSLVLLDLPSLSNATPEEVRSQLAAALDATLDRDEVKDVTSGVLAVTVNYRDGTQIQLLPAVRRRRGFAIASSDGKHWRDINPQEFAKRLSDVNTAQRGMVVRVIKLAKSIIASFPPNLQLSGYHVEALAVDAFSKYTVPKQPMAMLEHFFATAQRRVLNPIADITGQSSSLDGYLGPQLSERRRQVSASLARVARTMENAQTVAAWRDMFDLID
jgi:hypothetical protein